MGLTKSVQMIIQVDDDFNIVKPYIKEIYILVTHRHVNPFGPYVPLVDLFLCFTIWKFRQQFYFR